ncbi:hypothetical protein [Ectothiorhodospira shaposhnikovii]|uniref:hypothetical protein n=1 Tax=Ectothiorhodospira shaposhnikovii TaxID=1054 RepID=UPI00399F1BDD
MPGNLVGAEGTQDAAGREQAGRHQRRVDERHHPEHEGAGQRQGKQQGLNQHQPHRHQGMGAGLVAEIQQGIQGDGLPEGQHQTEQYRYQGQPEAGFPFQRQLCNRWAA